MSTHLVISPKFREAMNVGGSRRRRAEPPGNTKIGTDSLKACATPENEFSTPGPFCMAQTPVRCANEARVKPSAIPTPTLSLRVMMGRIPSLEPASKTEFCGNPLMNSTPSIFRILAMAVIPCMHTSPR